MRTLARFADFMGAIALFGVMTIVFVAVFVRYVFNFAIPDAFDLSRMLLGVVVFWGIALTVLQNNMIRIDFLFDVVGPTAKSLISVFAAIVTLAVISLLAWRVWLAILDARSNGIGTSELHIPLWYFHSTAGLALFMAVFGAVRHIFRRDGEVDNSRGVDE